MVRWFAAFVWLLCSMASHAGELAFTFDDGFDPVKDASAVDANARLLAAISRAKVQAMLFPAGRNVDSAEGMRLVADWSRAGHAVGNHTYSHRSLGSTRTPLAEFIADTERGDAIFRKLPTFTPMLRFPYLKEGDTAAKRDGVRDWMRTHGYKDAGVTIDTSDWYFNQRYLAVLQSGRSELVPVIRKAYLAHLLDRANYYDELARRTIARSPAHVMLLHTNRINADFFGDVAEAFRAAGWTIVSPQAAFADPIHAMPLAGLPAGESVIWALAHDAGARNLRYPAEDDVYEKPALDALGLPDTP